MSFGSDLLGDTSSFSRLSSTVQGKVGKALRYSETVTGSLGGWDRKVSRIYVECRGAAKGGAGNAQLWFLLDTPAGGRYEYRATASLASVSLAQDGSAIYRFTGSYALSTAPAAAAAIMPREGKIALTLKFWSDASLYASAIELFEVS
jgi:hypothetical protein